MYVPFGVGQSPFVPGNGIKVMFREEIMEYWFEVPHYSIEDSHLDLIGVIATINHLLTGGVTRHILWIHIVYIIT